MGCGLCGSLRYSRPRSLAQPTYASARSTCVALLLLLLRGATAATVAWRYCCYCFGRRWQAHPPLRLQLLQLYRRHQPLLQLLLPRHHCCAAASYCLNHPATHAGADAIVPIKRGRARAGRPGG